MSMRVDFSAPGTYSSSVNSKPHWLENAFLALDLPKRLMSETNPEMLLSGLEGTYEILDESGKQIYRDSLKIDPNNLRSHRFKSLIEFYNFPSWYEFVQWQIVINITKGAPKLKDVPQRLILFDQRLFSRTNDLYEFYCVANLILAAVIFIIVSVVSIYKKKQLSSPKVATVDGK